MRYSEILSEDRRLPEDDPRFQNDGLTDDPDHPILRDRGAWGSSHSSSSQITGHAAQRMGASGYRPVEKDPHTAKLAHNKLAAIAKSPGSREPLYHGFQNRRHIEWKVGDILTLPLTATSGDLQDSAGYGVRLDIKDNEGPPTVFEFPKGTKMVGYGKWKPSDAADFGHVWSEAIIAGRFRIVSVRQELYNGTWRRDLYLTVVRLEPVAYFDPEVNAWVNT